MPDEKQSERRVRTVTLHFEETCSYAVPIETTRTDEELRELYDDDAGWMKLVDEYNADIKEPEERWDSACCTGVIDRQREAIYDEEGRGI